MVLPPCSSAAAAVITLAVEPGVNWFCTAMSELPSEGGHWAMARMAPVFGFSTTAVQSCALVFFTWAWQACWACSCSAGMIVVSIDWPFTAGVSCDPASGICWPDALRSTVLLARRAGQQLVVDLFQARRSRRSRRCPG